MKFYITGRSNNYQRVQEVCQKLKAVGHEITFEWTELPMVKPYEEHAAEAAEYAKQSVAGMADTDVYIIFAHADGNGVYCEFGSALASNQIKGTPKIYAVGKEARGAAMFNYHPAVEWFDSIEEVYEKIGLS